MTTSIGKLIFGFLNLILQRKKKIVEEFLINPSDKQLDGKSYLNDDDIEKLPSLDRNGVLTLITGRMNDAQK